VITVSSLNGTSLVVAAYNDDTGVDKTIQYTDTSRTVLAGASLMGWSTSSNLGQSWTYRGKIRPNADWPVLWGDPAMTSSFRNQTYVFLSNLAVPSSKLPAAGIECDLNNYWFCMNSALGGACIARSTDGGAHFSLYQCVTNNNDFYDGGSMTDAGDGEIFAAYVDMNRSQIDVWRASNENGQFAMIAPPFPNQEIVTHARLRADRNTGSIYAAAQASNGVIWINRWSGEQWGTAVAASQPSPVYPLISLSDRTLRTGPQFSFDFGTPSQNGNDAIRMLYTTKYQADHLYIRGSFCKDDLSGGCWDAPEWGTTPGNLNITGDQLQPNVRAFSGFFSLRPVWKSTYLSREHAPNGNTVSLEQGNLVVLPDGVRVLLPFDQILNLLVCSDERGYWGDYNDLQLIGFDNNGNAQFLSVYTDSSQGFPLRQEFRSENVHVSSTEEQ
jgi:hypothetical protein